MRRIWMFSPILEISAARPSSTVSPEASLASFSDSMSVPSTGSAASATALVKATKLSSLATKSVSELISTRTALPPLWAVETRPSAVTRLAFLSALASPDLRRASAAASMSPLLSVSAFLHSIIPAPVRSRSSLTIEAVIAAMLMLNLEYGCRAGRGPPSDRMCAPLYRAAWRGGVAQRLLGGGGLVVGRRLGSSLFLGGLVLGRSLGSCLLGRGLLRRSLAGRLVAALAELFLAHAGGGRGRG